MGRCLPCASPALSRAGPERAGRWPAADAGAGDVLNRVESFISARVDAFDGDRDVPVHADLHLGNVLVDEGRISGLIDFEGFRLAPADTELDMLLRSIRWALASPETGSMDYEMVPRCFAEHYPGLFAQPRLIERLEVYEGLWHLVQLHWHPAGGSSDPVGWLERLVRCEFRGSVTGLLG